MKFSRYQGEIQQSFSDEWIDSHRNQHGFISLEVMVETFLNDLKANNIDLNRLLELYGTGSISEIRSAIAHPDISLGKLRRYIVMMTIYFAGSI